MTAQKILSYLGVEGKKTHCVAFQRYGVTIGRRIRSRISAP